MIKKGKLVTITHIMKRRGHVFCETREAEVVVIVQDGHEDDVIWMDLKVKRNIDQQEANYHYLMQRKDSVEVKTWTDTNLSEAIRTYA